LSPIHDFGTAEQKEKWLPTCWRVARCGLRLTEPEAGSDGRRDQDAAEDADGKWVVNGAKAVHHQTAATHISAV